MFGLTKWEKFRDRVMHSSLGLTKIQLETVLGAIKIAKAKNKRELVLHLEAVCKHHFGPHASREFQNNPQAVRFWGMIKKVKDNLVDAENFKS